MKQETNLKNKIFNYLNSISQSDFPLLVFRRQAGGFSYNAGLPDLFFVWDGQHVEVELKAPDGKIRNLQLKWFEKFARKNITMFIVDNFESFKSTFENKFLFPYLQKKN